MLGQQEKYELLLDELESFIDDEAFAISQSNWAYLGELLVKKENHLRAIIDLKAQVSENPELRHQMERINAKEIMSGNLMKEKMDEMREAQETLAAAKARLYQVRELARLQSLQALTPKAYSAQA